MKKSDFKITGEQFYRFFQCPHWIWYDVYADDSKKAPERSELLELIYHGGLKNPKKAISSRKFEEINRDLYRDLDEAFLATLELMKAGKNIYHGVLMHQHWVGMPDLLEAKPMPKGRKSAFGDHFYVPYDIKSASGIREDTKFQLVFYAMILERIQGYIPPEAYFIDIDGNETGFDVRDYLDYFDLNIERIEQILSGNKPAPFLKSGCKQSPWFTLCIDDAQSCDDVSLIYSLSQTDQKRLYDIGIKTVHELAKSSLDDLSSKLEDWTFDKIMKFHTQANSLVQNETKILRQPKFPDSDVEVFFDVESDPTEELIYLLGLLVVTDGKEEYVYFWADDKEGEKKMWDDFLSYLEQLPPFTMYHYSRYEPEVIARLANKYGISRELDNFIKGNSIDVHKTANESVVLPLYFYGLKDIGAYIGYKWRAEDAGGAESVVWYSNWQTLLRQGSGGASEAKKIKKKILEYNEDDVRATKFVKEWLSKQKPRLQKEKLD